MTDNQSIPVTKHFWKNQNKHLILQSYSFLLDPLNFVIDNGYKVQMSAGCNLNHVNTVFSPINGHSKMRTPLISGQSFFHWPNSGQSLIKTF